MQEFTVASRVKDSNIEQSLAASYKTDKYSVLAQINPAGKVTLLSRYTFGIRITCNVL